MNLFTSFMRTVVPIVAGFVLSLAARVGLDLDDATVTTEVTAAVTAAYYAVFRLLEAWAERLGREPLRLVAGVLLGWARPPDYTPVGARPSSRSDIIVVPGEGPEAVQG